jgi:hypothetical protein
MKLAAFWILAALAACGHSSPANDSGDPMCPPPTYDGANGDTIEGAPCASDATCFVENTFSSCASGWYKCVSGRWHSDHGIDAVDGASCAGSPLQSCAVEGNDCSAEPTGIVCACDAGGLWTCTCRCYNAFGADCACPATYRDLSGVGCGGDCTYPTGHSCTCVKSAGALYGTFQCS